MTGRRSPLESGFTLLEVLVTLSILAIGVSLALSVISGSLANIRKVQVRNRTIQHAETVMELSLLDEAIRQPTTLRGDFEDGTRWSLVINEMPMPDPPQMPVLGQQIVFPVKMLSYNVEVYAPGSTTPDMRLQTLKVVNKQEPQNLMRMPGAVR